MKKIISIFTSCFVAFVFSTFAQTRNIVPRESGEGSIGTSEKPWGAGYFSNSLTLGQKTISEFNEASTRLVSTNVNQFSSGETIEIDGIIGSVYDDTIKQEETIYFGNGDFTIRESEDWKGNATTLVVSSDGLTGTLDGVLNEKCVSDGVWLYLFNSTTNVAIFATNVNAEKTVVQWNTEKQTLDADSLWTIEKVSPLKQVKHIGMLYGHPSGISAETSTNVLWNIIWTGTLSGNGDAKIITHDGVTLFISYYNGVAKSTDGGNSWKVLTSAPVTSSTANSSCIATSDGKTVFCALVSRGVWKSTDGGETWKQILKPGETAAPTGLGPGIVTANSNIVFLVWQNRTDGWKSTDGGETWKSITVPLGNSVPRLATLDGITVFLQYFSKNTIWKSTDGGESWINMNVTFPYSNIGDCDIAVANNNNTLFVATQSRGLFVSKDSGHSWEYIDKSTPQWSSVTTIDGITVFNYRHSELNKIYEQGYSQSLNTFYTAILDIKTNNLTKLNDIVFSKNGNNLYASFETNPDEWSVFGSDLSWHIIATKDENEIWNVRTTDTSVYPYHDSMVLTTASSAPEAISIALETNSFNRTDLYTYYTAQTCEYVNLTNNNLAIAFTYYVPTANSNNTPALVSTIMDYYGVGEMQENMKDYEVVLDASENKTTVTRTGEVDANAMIYYIKNKEEQQ